MQGVSMVLFTPVAERVLAKDVRRPRRAAVVRPAGHGADLAARAAARALSCRRVSCFASHARLGGNAADGRGRATIDRRRRRGVTGRERKIAN
jgi:hypothetical protein